MLGPRSAGELAGTAWAARRTLSESWLRGRRPSIEDRFATLQSRAGGRRSGRNDRRLIHWPRSRLRHHHAARRWLSHTLSGGLRRGDSGLSGNCRHRRWRLRHRSARFNGFRCCGQKFSGRSGWRLRLANRGHCGWGLRGGFFLGARLLLAYGWCCGGLHHNYGTRTGNGSRRRLCNDCARRRTAGNRRGRWWRRNDGRRGARLRNNLARFRMGGSCGHWFCGDGRGSSCRSGCRAHLRLGRLCRRRRFHRYPRVARLFFLFVLFGQNRLQHIARFLDVRQIDLRNNRRFGVA